MKRFIITVLLTISAFAVKAQPEALIQMWRSIDAVQLLYAERVIDYAYIEMSEEKIAESQGSVTSSTLPFGYTIIETIQKLEKNNFIKDYDIDENTYRMSAKLFGNECALFIDAINGIVCQYYALFNREYKDFDALRGDFQYFESCLNKVFGEPSFKGRDAGKKYLKLSAIRNDIGLQYGNIYNFADGTVVLAAVPVFNASAQTDGVKILIYYMHTESMGKGLKK